jgi:hypothetical protein
MGFIFEQAVAWLLQVVLTGFLDLLSIIEKGLLVSPDVTGLPQVQALTGKSVWIVDTVFVLAFVATGTLTMLGGSERARYEVKDLLPRLIVAFVAAHFSPLFCGLLIEAANAFTAAVTDQSLGGTGALTAVGRHVQSAASNPQSPLLAAILIAIITVLLANTALGLLTRFGVLLILAVIAPVALAMHALPQTDPIARLWWRSIGGCLVTPCLQALTLQAGTWMLLDPAHLLPMLGLPGDPTGVVNLLVVIVLLYTTVKIPSLVRRHVTRAGGGPNVLGAVVRVVLVQQGSRALGLPRGLTRIRR